MSPESTQARIVSDARAGAQGAADALSKLGFRADFSIESLRDLDRFFDENCRDGEPRPGGELSQDLGSRLFAIGGYLGETIIRNAGGSWVGDDADPSAEINLAIKLPDGSLIWPIQRVMKRCTNGAEDSLYVYGRVIAQRDMGS